MRKIFQFESVTGMVTGIFWAFAKYLAPLIVLLIIGAVLLSVVQNLACSVDGLALASGVLCY